MKKKSSSEKKKIENNIKKSLALLSKMGMSYILKTTGNIDPIPEFSLDSLSTEQQSVVNNTYKNTQLKPNL